MRPLCVPLLRTSGLLLPASSLTPHSPPIVRSFVFFLLLLIFFPRVFVALGLPHQTNVYVDEALGIQQMSSFGNHPPTVLRPPTPSQYGMPSTYGTPPLGPVMMAVAPPSPMQPTPPMAAFQGIPSSHGQQMPPQMVPAMTSPSPVMAPMPHHKQRSKNVAEEERQSVRNEYTATMIPTITTPPAT